MANILASWQDFGLYSLWLYTLSLNFASSLILFSQYMKSKGTPIGRTAFYFFLNSLCWSFASAIITIPLVLTIRFPWNYFYLSFPFLAGIASILGAYERTRIQILLTPGAEKRTPDNRIWLILSLCTLGISSVGVIGVIVNNPVLILVVRGMGGFTGLGFVVIGGLFIALAQHKLNIKLITIGSAFLLVIGLVALVGRMQEIPTLYSPLPFGPTAATTVTTTVIFIIVGLWMATVKLLGLKWWIVRVFMAFIVLSTLVLAVVTSFTYHPQDLTSPVSLLILLVGGALLWRSWKMPPS